jgi:hypothetical protein
MNYDEGLWPCEHYRELDEFVISEQCNDLDTKNCLDM